MATYATYSRSFGKCIHSSQDPFAFFSEVVPLTAKPIMLSANVQDPVKWVKLLNPSILDKVLGYFVYKAK